MGLESASYPNQLVATNPTGSDPKSTADDHIRLLKSVIQTTFPNLTGAMTAAQADLNKVGVTQPQTSNDTSVSSTAFVQTAVAAAITAIGAGASMWVSGTTYALGNVVWSPSNYQTYRRIIAGAGTTDPASDATNWVLVSGNVQTTATQTLTNKTLTSPVISTISNTGTLTLPTTTDTLVGRATTDTLTNKTLDAPVITGGASISGNVAVTGTLDTTGSVSFGTTNKSNGRVSIQAGTSASGDPLFMQNLDGTNNPHLWVRQSSAGTKLYASSSSGGAASNLVLASAGVDVATVSSSGLAVTGTGSYTGNVQIASGAGTGVVAVGDAIGGTLNCGIYRGAAGTTASGDYLNIDGYAGITFSTGSAAIGSKGVKATIDASGNLQVMGPRLSIGDAGYVALAPGGNVVLNLESLSGLATAGLLLVRGNENSLNQSIAVYSYNLSFTGSTRYCRIIQMHRNVLNNTYGDVYAYLSNYAGSYTTADQSYSSNATSMSDIYMRNAAGAAGTANYAIIRLA